MCLRDWRRTNLRAVGAEGRGLEHFSKGFGFLPGTRVEDIYAFSSGTDPGAPEENKMTSGSFLERCVIEVPEKTEFLQCCVLLGKPLGWWWTLQQHGEGLRRVSGGDFRFHSYLCRAGISMAQMMKDLLFFPWCMRERGSQLICSAHERIFKDPLQYQPLQNHPQIVTLTAPQSVVHDHRHRLLLEVC